MKAIILLSGGIDSSVCLALAKSQGFDCYALSIDYHQRNRCELTSAAAIASHIGVVEHRIIQCELGAWGGSALTDHESVNTYVPARNIIFLSLALGWAETLQASHIFFAANAEDFANYPDCRSEFFSSFTKTANVATCAGTAGADLQIHTPLLHWNKARIIQEGHRLNVDLSLTFSCYDPTPDSQPCQNCLACHLRLQGFANN